MGERFFCPVKEDQRAGVVKLGFKCEKDDFLDKLEGISKGRLLFFWCPKCSHVVVGKGYQEWFDGTTRI